MNVLNAFSRGVVMIVCLVIISLKWLKFCLSSRNSMMELTSKMRNLFTNFSPTISISISLSTVKELLYLIKPYQHLFMDTIKLLEILGHLQNMWLMKWLVQLKSRWRWIRKKRMMKSGWMKKILTKILKKKWTKITLIIWMNRLSQIVTVLRVNDWYIS